MATVKHEQGCREAWLELAQLLELPERVCSKWWLLLVAFFREERRHYHTFEHISELLELTSRHKEHISNYAVVMLAIFFHDIVYNPQSAFNEEDSNDIFLQFVTDCNSHVVSNNAMEVFRIIEMTKKHRVPPDATFDMKFFSDIDMGILGSNRKRYEKYSAQIRLEFNFVEFKTFCTKRSEFLLSSLPKGSPLFCTNLFRKEREQQALDNIMWEYNLLKKFQCPVQSWNESNSDKVGSSSSTERGVKKLFRWLTHENLLFHVLLTVVVVLPISTICRKKV